MVTYSKSVVLRALGVAAAALVLALWVSPSAAQQRTFHLDRLEVGGTPDDGIMIMRPVTQQRTIFYAQLGLGYSLRPLRTTTITSDPTTLKQSSNAVISNQFTQYTSVGVELADRFIFGLTLPVTWIQTGGNPNYSVNPLFGGQATTTVRTGGPTVDDIRLDFRGIALRSEDRKAALGAGLHVFIPMGTVFNENFGSDGQVTTMLSLNGEYTIKWITLVASTGFHFRPYSKINDPERQNGLGVSSEWRWAVGAFIPLKEGRYRIGATIQGQTGIDSDPIGDTAFTKRNTPIEWQLEGRMRIGSSERWWAGLGAGSFIQPGYGAPDLRVVGVLGAYVPILDSDATSPDRKAALRDKWRKEHVGDRDGDGIPDDIDACPDEPEDHLGPDPNDGCPMLADRDGDGIPDKFDKCPDVPEDKDGIQDEDGCPETDADNDGIPDTEDACPLKPGKPNKDPKLNGCPLVEISTDEGKFFTLQQVHFKTGSAEILPDSFPMLQEVVDLLKQNQDIKRMSIEGHTDNTGGMDLNMRLSAARAASVMNWLTQHGIPATRLESHGYGPTKPVDTNDTPEGRGKNRRVEFKIVEQDGQKPKKP
jgi:outer membrane protein OmpA-like peptidoglycan-associated protein